jgi:lipopolysaccharide transport system permease protein
MNSDSTAPDERRVLVIAASPPLTDLVSAGLASLWNHKSLLLEMTMLRLKVRYRQSILGWTWAVIPPLLLMITYTLIFSKVAGLKTGELPYALFVFSGLILWTFFSTSVGTATAGMVAHRYLITRVAFPREIIPLSYVFAAMVDLVIGLLMLLAMMLYFGIVPTIYAFYALPIITMHVACCIAAALCCSAFQARFRDVGLAMPLLLQVLMFTTPVVYSSEAIPHSARSIYFANPIAIQVEAFRKTIVLGLPPDAGALLYCAAVSVICLGLSFVLFKRLDIDLADVI